MFVFIRGARLDVLTGFVTKSGGILDFVTKSSRILDFLTKSNRIYKKFNFI